MGIYQKVPRSGPIPVQRTNVGAERLKNCLATNCNCISYTYHDALGTISKIFDSVRYRFLLWSD